MAARLAVRPDATLEELRRRLAAQRAGWTNWRSATSTCGPASR
ncbi:hypothetical protein OHA72_58525 [Dactylosporangium sp. NBC_01737]|nr:hypothetical protein OHA72_58525 [Dactylosporangium sp. NBC_01737]